MNLTETIKQALCETQKRWDKPCVWWNKQASTCTYKGYCTQDKRAAHIIAAIEREQGATDCKPDQSCIGKMCFPCARIYPDRQQPQPTPSEGELVEVVAAVIDAYEVGEELEPFEYVLARRILQALRDRGVSV